MLQENLFLYHRKPLAFSVLSITSNPGGLRRGVWRKSGLCTFLRSSSSFFFGKCVCVLAKGSPDKPGLLEFTCLLPSHSAVPSWNSESNSAPRPSPTKKKDLFQLMSQFGRETGKSWDHPRGEGIPQASPDS